MRKVRHEGATLNTFKDIVNKNLTSKALDINGFMSGKSYWFRNQGTFNRTQRFTSTQLISGEITAQVESVGGAEESPPLYHPGN